MEICHFITLTSVLNNSDFYSPMYCNPAMSENPNSTDKYALMPVLSFFSTSKNTTYSSVPVAIPCNMTLGTSRFSAFPEAILVSNAPTPMPAQ